MKLVFVTDDPVHGRCWRRKEGEKEFTYTRVICGVAVPTSLEEPKGAAVVLAEAPDPEGGAGALEALEGRVASWGDLERHLVAFRRMMRVETFIVEDESVDLLRRIRGLREAASLPLQVVPPAPAVAPEIMRQQANELLRQRRLDLSRVEAALGEAPEPAARAISVAVAWLVSHPVRLRSQDERDEMRATNRRRARSYSGQLFGPEEHAPAPPMLGLPQDSPRPRATSNMVEMLRSARRQRVE